MFKAPQLAYGQCKTVVIEADKAKRLGFMDAKSGHNLAAAEQKTVRRHLLLRLDGLIWAIH